MAGRIGLTILALSLAAIAGVQGFVGVYPLRSHHATSFVSQGPLHAVSMYPLAVGALGRTRLASSHVQSLRGAADGGGVGTPNSAWAVLVGADGKLSNPTMLMCPPGYPGLNVDAVKKAAKAEFADDLE
eukprot:CAMPEP_0173389616 /NCGR_PEP_ID=MMETSP1356-20130122/12758_1 /TAXON_ID=77927 ORGANISM="Hemiselmis virescens, Strain PCC157" /NCGR_SAMPLE_ID=MMETSP1356 /ASSEMBLY_ACC=CAM_ASM_000847 /LENGTH=128 /DNA_ID=CAMNT_0014346827 /DNA_START=80 /DNA_END=463 /DNA_ORIENTATION=+